MPQAHHSIDHYVAELVRATSAGERPAETSTEEDLFIQAHPLASRLISQAAEGLDTKERQLALLQNALAGLRRINTSKESKVVAIKRTLQELSRVSVSPSVRLYVAIEAIALGDGATKEKSSIEVEDSLILELETSPQRVSDLWEAAAEWSNRRRALPQRLIDILNLHRLDIRTPEDEALLARALASPNGAPSSALEALRAQMIEHIDLLPLGYAGDAIAAASANMSLKVRLLKRAVHEVKTAHLMGTPETSDPDDLRLTSARADRSSILKPEHMKEHLRPASPQAILEVLALIGHLPASEDALKGSTLVYVLHAAGKMNDSIEGRNGLWQTLLGRDPVALEKSHDKEELLHKAPQSTPEERALAWQELEAKLLEIEAPSVIVLEVIGLRWPDNTWSDKLQDYFVQGLLAHGRRDFGQSIATRPGLQHGLKTVSSEALERWLNEVSLERRVEVLQEFVRYHGNLSITDDFRLHLTSSPDGNIRQLAILLPGLGDQPEEDLPQPRPNLREKRRSGSTG